MDREGEFIYLYWSKYVHANIFCISTGNKQTYSCHIVGTLTKYSKSLQILFSNINAYTLKFSYFWNYVRNGKQSVRTHNSLHSEISCNMQFLMSHI